MKLKHNFLIKNIVIASDHAGFSLKESIKKELKKRNFKILDLGTKNENKSVDYPTYAKKLAKKINSKNYGILVCGSGIGMSIAYNRFKNVRSALANSINASKLSRQHNNANVICIPARFVTEEAALEIIAAFLATDFEGGRHQNRVEKINL